jgi:hypothetical protein
LGSEPLRIQAERPVLSTTSTAIAPLLIGPVNLPGLLKGRAYLEQYDSGALAIRITCVNDAPGSEQLYGLFSIRPAAAVAETLRPWEFLAHVRGENAQLAATLAATGLFEHVRGVQLRPNGDSAGGELLPTWRVAGEKLPADLRAAASARFGWPENYERNRRVLPSQLPEIVKLEEPLTDDVPAVGRPRQGG